MCNKPTLTCTAFLLVMRKEEFLTEVAPCNKNVASLVAGVVKDLSRQSLSAIEQGFFSSLLRQVQP